VVFEVTSGKTSVEEDVDIADWDDEGGNAINTAVASLDMFRSSGSMGFAVTSGRTMVISGGDCVTSFGSVVVVVTFGETVVVVGGNCVANFEPKGSAQVVSGSEDFLFTMSSNGVERSSMTSPDNSQII
jgi:hypothetical protein